MAPRILHTTYTFLESLICELDLMETQSRFSVMSYQREGFRPAALSEVSVVSLVLLEEAIYITLAVPCIAMVLLLCLSQRAESGQQSR